MFLGHWTADTDTWTTGSRSEGELLILITPMLTWWAQGRGGILAEV